MHIGLILVLVLFYQKAYALQETYYKETTLDVPYREQAIIIGKEGFYPNRIVVYKGEKVRFFVTSVGVDSACFNIPDKNVFSSSSKEKIAESEVFFDKVGVFQFNCPNNTFTGRVMVLEKASDREETSRRGLASDLVKVWKPKETPSEWVQIKRSDLKEDYMDLDHVDHDRIQKDETPKDQEREMIGFGSRELAAED
jgi:plastocyanin domain-containing protein